MRGRGEVTHYGSMPESAGTFTLGLVLEIPCRTCEKITPHLCQVWHSNDGAYVDEKFTCNVCGRVHWVDGIDS